jgi:hypothetical protein
MEAFATSAAPGDSYAADSLSAPRRGARMIPRTKSWQIDRLLLRPLAASAMALSLFLGPGDTLVLLAQLS